MPWFYQQILSMVESYSTALSRGVVCVILLWPLCVADADIIFMAAPSNRAGHYIFALWFFLYHSSSSFFPRLISAVPNWMSTILPHMVWP